MVGETSLSPQIVQFITDFIDSVVQLEILLLLQTNPQQAWSAQSLARELRLEPGGAVNELSALANRGLIAPAPQDDHAYRYAPRNPDLDKLVVSLAQAYLLRRVTIISLIFSKPNEKLRSFSDAFRLRKEDPHE